MIDGQLLPNGITNEALLAAMALVPREFFVPIDFTGAAYVDEEIPLPGNRMLMEPLVLARLIQALELKGHERVLIIGGALGYSAAVIAHLATEVVMVEQASELITHARSSLPMLGLRNIDLIESPLAAPKVQGSFDTILIEGAVQELPSSLVALLKVDGKIAYVENRALRSDGVHGTPIGLGTLTVAYRRNSVLSSVPMAEAGVALLPGFTAKPAFTFA